MLRARFGFVAALIALVGVSMVVADDKSPPKETPKTTPETRETEALVAAFRMAQYGRENKVPEVMIAAARVIGTTNFRDFQLVEGKTEGDAVFDGKKFAMELVDEAMAMDTATDAVKILGKATKERIEENKKGATNGPQTRRGSVSAGDRQDTYAIRFRGGEPAMVMVNNRTNRGDIDLYVENDNGQIVARDTRSDDDASVTWYPSRTGTFYIKVRYFNGSGVLRYTLTTN